MPVRLALATSDTHVPVPSAPYVFSAPGLDNGKFKYVLRTLRAGYLYVHDEVRKRWSAYLVTGDGYYYGFDPLGAPPNGDVVTFACSRDAVDTTLASCITVPHTAALPAGKLFLGFSDVAWTSAVLARYQQLAYRRQHMTEVDMAAWIGSHAANFCAELAKADKEVAEFALSAATGTKAFEWSPFAFKSKAVQGSDGKTMGLFKALTEAARLKNERRTSAGEKPLGLQTQHGAIVRLRDPVSIVRESTRLLQFKTQQFMTDRTRSREMTLSSAIAAVKSAVADKAVKDEIAAGEELADRQITDSGGSIRWTEAGRRMNDALRVTTRAEAARVRARSWEKYAKKLKGGQPETFDAKFKVDLAEFDAQWVTTLADFHRRWLVDASMGDYFTSNFDSTDILNGFAYQGVVSVCFEHMADTKPFADQCAEWLAGNPNDRGNLLLRALVLNNDQFAQKVVAAANAPLDWRTPGWENVGGWFKEAFGAVHKAAYETWLAGKGPADATARFFVHISGPLIRFIAPELANPSLAAKTALMAMGVTSNAHIVPVDVFGSKKAFRAALVRQLLRSTDQTFSGRQLEKAVADELRRLEVEGVALAGNSRQRWLLAVDENAARAAVDGLPAGAKPMQRAQRLAQSIVTPEALENATSRSTLGRVMNMEVRLGILTAILQCISLSKAMADEDSAMKHESEEVKWKLRAGWLGLAGTIAEASAIAISRIPALTLRAAQGLSGARWTLGSTTAFRVAGRWLGAIGGLIVAITDLLHFKEEAQQYNWGMAGLYLASSVVGGVLAVGLLAGFLSGGVAIILLIVLVGLALVIELFKDDKIQDWLERTLWGIEGDSYGSSDVEMKQLGLAIGGA